MEAEHEGEGERELLGLDKMIDEKRNAKAGHERVHDGPVLGSGISGLVRLATHRATGLKYATATSSSRTSCSATRGPTPN